MIIMFLKKSLMIFFLTSNFFVSVFGMSGQQKFNVHVKKQCEGYLKTLNFYDLKIVLYNHSGEQDCLKWFLEYAKQGHCWALYMMVRYNYFRHGSGNVEIDGDSLISVLEWLMKFIVRFDQDFACCKALGQDVSDELPKKIRTKMRDWIIPMIGAECKDEFGVALERVKAWGQSLTEKLEKKDVKEAADLLPTPVCVRSMIWQNPSTLSYVQVQDDWISACSEAESVEIFRKTRLTILQTLLTEFQRSQHTREFIESLSDDRSGWWKKMASYVLG